MPGCEVGNICLNLINLQMQPLCLYTHEGRTQINQLFKTKKEDKTYKHVIDLYFESVPHSIRTFSVHGNTLIYIEYEDYLSEHHVTEALLRLLGTSVLLSIKRNCSERLFQEIQQRYGLFMSQLELCAVMSEYEA